MNREHPTGFGSPLYWIGGRIALALIALGAWLTPGEPHDLEEDE